jgi:hypothetical protein
MEFLLWTATEVTGAMKQQGRDDSEMVVVIDSSPSFA